MRALQAQISQLDPPRVSQLFRAHHGLLNVQSIQQGEFRTGFLGTANSWDCQSRTCSSSSTTHARANALLLTSMSITSTVSLNTREPRQGHTSISSRLCNGYSTRQTSQPNAKTVEEPSVRRLFVVYRFNWFRFRIHPK